MSLIGVILAAGKSTRMTPFSDHYPKPILPILNKPVLTHQLLQMKSMGITEVIIVVGHLSHEIVRQLERDPVEGLSLQYIDQGETLGIAHAVGKLENIITRPFMLMLGDIYFISTELKKSVDLFLRKKDVHGMLISRQEANIEAIKRNYAILLSSDGSVRRVIEKPRYVENNLKGVGIYLFDLPIFDAIRRTPRTAMRDEYEITDSIQILINDGFRVEQVNAVEEDMNLTYPSDVLDINRFEMRRMGMSNFVDESAVISEEVTIQQCVIGPRAVIGQGCVLDACVIFADAVVPAETHISYAIFTPYQSIKCSKENHLYQIS
ncbi:NTP transferase domain-containing protein [bacterium]|nr:NTP transferase domain-containing protein [bacterium]